MADKKRLTAWLLALIVFIFAACYSPPKIPDITPPQKNDSLLLTFAGDIMAHTVNYNMQDYSLIYKDIAPLLKNDGLSFANFETPVVADNPYESYPTFNVQPPYAQAAIDAGFDVFSLANNHTNDQGLKGIDATLDFFSNAGVTSAGIKQKTDSSLTHNVIEVNGWKVLFAAVTEILNSPVSANRIDYIAPNKKSRDEFTARIAALREENPCDIFVLSVHSGEEEYIHTVSQTQKDFYRSLLDAGVDILWANHVHIAREWEIIGSEKENGLKKLIIYSAGNTISGQRTRLNFSNPANNRDYTGDGFLFSVQIERNVSHNGWNIVSVIPTIITTYRDSENRYLIKILNDAFINSLRESEKTQEADYFLKRKELMEAITGHTLWL